VRGFGYELVSVSGVAQADFSVGIDTIRTKWFSTEALRSARGAGTTIVDCKVSRTGTIKRTKVAESSGDRSLDSAAIATISGVSFHGMPSHFKGGEFRLHFIHDLSSPPEHPACGSVSLASFRKAGGSVTPPRVTFQPNPDYSEEARKSKYQGSLQLGVTALPDGTASDVCVERALGMGLDEKAVEVVRQWKFQPGLEHGKPLPVRMRVEVSFLNY